VTPSCLLEADVVLARVDAERPERARSVDLLDVGGDGLRMTWNW